MQRILTIKGIHCEACKKLIELELSDQQLDPYVDSVVITDAENKQGELRLNNVSNEVLEKIIKTINKMDGYSAFF